MLTMILADDEPIITKGIRKLLDWDALGIEIIDAFENGRQALRAILTCEPDIAILDIAMPGMTGIDILREIGAAGSKTRVIFLSGFQDFSYAQAALRYGAVDYLLKPVKKNGLLSAIGKCALQTESVADDLAESGSKPEFSPDAYKELGHETSSSYILVTVQPIGLDSKNDMERQLTWFSVFSAMEETVARDSGGIAFQRRNRTYLILKDMSKPTARAWLTDLGREVEAKYGCRLGFVMSDVITEIQNIESESNSSDEMLGYFYFYDCLESSVLEAGVPAYGEEHADSELLSLQGDILRELSLRNREGMDEAIERYLTTVGRAAGTRSDVAVYYLLSCIRLSEERLQLADDNSRIDDAVRELQGTSTYMQVSRLFREFMAFFFDVVSSATPRDEKLAVLRSKQYIEEHFAENISLETMAKQIHMNSFYFSSYSKKHTGQNFKDYLSEVRMKHAMDLLMTTDKKSYEISEDVGFKDYRYFSELFSRHYGETPAAYRKSAKQNQRQEERHGT